MGCDRDSLLVITLSTQMEGLYAHNTGMYARKKAAMVTASDIVLSSDWFRVRWVGNRHSNVSFNDSRGGVENSVRKFKKVKGCQVFP